MKHFYALFIRIIIPLLLILCSFSCALAEDFEIRDGILLRYIGQDTHVTIPDGVTRIENDAFSCTYHPTTGEPILSKVTHLTMPDSVTSIGDYAFADCPDLTEIVFSKNLKTIGEGAFRSTSLKNVVFGESIESIGSYVLSNCSKLETVRFLAKTTDFGLYLLNECDHEFDVYAYYGTFAWAQAENRKNIRLHYLDKEDIHFTLEKNGVMNIWEKTAWERNPDIGIDELSVFPECINSEDLNWTSSNPDVVDVVIDEHGIRFFGYKEGTATITASYGSGSYSQKIEVINVHPITFKPSEMTINMAIDAPIPEITYTLHPYYEHLADQLMWRSTNLKVVHVRPSRLELTPVGTGQAAIVADNFGHVYDKYNVCSITVINDPQDDGIPENEEAGSVFGDEDDLSKEPPVDVPVIVVPPSSANPGNHILSFDQDKKSNGKNTVVYNIHLRDRHGNKVELPGECILCFPYPEGLDENSQNKYRIIIHHDAGSGKTEIFKSEDGDIEFTKQGLCIRVSSLSPFAISWEVLPDAIPPQIGDLPKTGDNSHIILWTMLLTLTAAALLNLRRKTA